MSEFKLKGVAEQSAPSPSKKSKMKFDKKTIFIVGGIGIVVILLFTRLLRSNNEETVEYVGTAYGDEYGTNGVDTFAQMQAMSDGIMKNVQGMIQDSTHDTMDNVTGSINKLMEENNKRFESVLGEQEKKFESISSGNTDMFNAITQNLTSLQKGIEQNRDNITGILEKQNKPVATPTPTPTPSTTTPKDVKPTTPTPPKTTTPSKSALTPTMKPVTGKLNTSTSIVDLLKSKGVNSSMANRKLIANELGIKNYTGTASQNTQMLKLVKAKK